MNKQKIVDILINLIFWIYIILFKTFFGYILWGMFLMFYIDLNC